MTNIIKLSIIKGLAVVLTISFFISCSSSQNTMKKVEHNTFDIDQDLLLLQYDCKTDVDDLHSIAAFATLIFNPEYAKMHYHGVAGTYGIQDGLYVPPNDLMELTFGSNWTDADADLDAAVAKVMKIAKNTLNKKGDIWISEAGQSDFSAALIKAIKANMPKINTTNHIHIIQHSDWNEKSTAPENLSYVQQNSDYNKIPDGNAVGNGSPGFMSPTYTAWKDKMTNPQLIAIWELAIARSNQYNGKDGRYLNKAIDAGGMDFSDFSEVCWILGMKEIKDAGVFFEGYSN